MFSAFKMKYLTFFSTVCMTVVGAAASSILMGCDCHHFDGPDPGMAVGDLLCTDGSVVTFSEYVRSGREAVAIVYSVNSEPDSEIRGYALYLGDISDAAFSDSIPVVQGTSCDISAIDGNENTYALYKCHETSSPMALPVFDLWTYGQSAYIPSAAQLRQIQSVKDFLNPRIEAIGGDILPDSPDDCWYWSSTEVEGQQDIKAWLVSMHSGIIQETPKEQRHHCRPVVTIYRHNNNNGSSSGSDDELKGFRSDLKVTLSLDRSFREYSTVDSLIFNSRSSASWGMRYCVAAYRRDDPVPYDILTTYDAEVNFSLPPGLYKFVAWADPVPDYSGKSWFFYTDDFSEILLRHKYDYQGNDSGKVAFRGVASQRVAYNTRELQMTLTPAMGRFRLLATDTPSFTPGHVLICYADLPASIHGLTGDINLRWNDVGFVTVPSGSMLAFDNVLASSEEITVDLCVEIYDDRDNLRARVRKVSVPLVNGGVTTVQGNFYSTLQLEPGQSQGGIDIDTEFRETVEIEY